MNNLLLPLFLILFTAFNAASGPINQEFKIKNIGIPLMSNYRTQDYSSKSVTYGSQNFDVLHGDDGKMYFANIEGLLTFDGITWTRFRLPGRAGAYTLSKAQDGTIYVGGINEIGYLGSSVNGQLVYHSLRDQLDTVSMESFVIRYSFATTDEIVFIGDYQVFVYNPVSQEMKTIDSPDALRTSRVIQGILYTYRSDGLYRLKEVRWEKVRNSDVFNTNIGSNIWPLDINKDQTIIISRNGFFDFETEKRVSINPDVQRFLTNAILNSVYLINGKYISICTSKGILITDLSGNPIQFLDQKKGLTDNVTFNATIDNSGLLWIGTNSGIDKVDIFSPFTLFDERSGINANVSFVEKYHDDFFMASTSGTYKEEWNKLFNPLNDIRFDKLNPHESRFLIKSKDELFNLSSTGMLVYDNGLFKKVSGTGKEMFWTGMKYKNSENILLGSVNGKILHVSKQHDEWQVKHEIHSEFNNILFMSQGDGNDIWVCSRKAIYKLTYDKETGQLTALKNYGKSDGLPYSVDNYVFEIDSKPTFTTLKGIYVYDNQTDRFIKDERFVSTVGDWPVLRMTEDAQGNIYCLSDGYLILNKAGDGYRMHRLVNEKLINYNPFNVIAFDSANLLLPTFNAFVHVDPTIAQIQYAFDAKITSIRSIGTTDFIYYSGFGNIPIDFHLAPTHDAIRFKFSSSYFQNIDQTVYKWRLKGSGVAWSDWSSETSKDYTNLPHGEYTFEVIAKNIFFAESKPAAIKFIIGTPWYFTIWAYLLYGIGFLLFMWMVVRLNTRRLELDKRRLEQIVDERTEQINLQKDKLIEMDDLKGRFFLNISHELRTPLTLTMSTVDQALKGRYGSLNDELYANLKSSFRNSQRLLKMVNNILDISKLEGGSMRLNATKTDTFEILSKVIDFFSSKFFNKNIELKSNINSDTELYIDQDKFETIFINLIANAFKYTNEGGTILISQQEKKHKIVFSIKDNGIGIPEADLNHVFDRFYQSTHGPSDGGTGLGLALTKELVELHKGTISVKSDLNSGSEFYISFLKGKKHLSPDQISKKEIDTEFEILDDKYPLTDDLKENKKPELSKKDKSIDPKNPHILLVEDNSEMSKFIADLLSDRYRISIVENGQEALDFLENQVPDLILTDYLMPVMNGYEMAIEIKKSDEWAYIPMIFLTARTEEQDKIEVLNLGVDDYLFKPFSNDELQVRIMNLLNTKKQRVDFLSQKSIDPRDIEWKEFPSKLKLDIDNYIKVHIKEEITGEDLSTFTSQSERSLYRKVKVNTGLSLMQYIKEYRLRKARTLLETKEVHTVSEAAYSVGFNYLSHFTKNYKARFGKQPSEYLD